MGAIQATQFLHHGSNLTYTIDKGMKYASLSKPGQIQTVNLHPRIFYFSDLTFTSLPGNFVLLHTPILFILWLTLFPLLLPSDLSYTILPCFQTVKKFTYTNT